MENVTINDTILACFLTALCVFVVTLCGAGCQSARLQGDTGEVVAGNARAAGRLEATVRSLDDTIGDSRERLEIVARASERIAGGVDRAEFLFSEYEQEVGRLLDEIDRIRTEAQAEAEADPPGAGTDGPVHSGAYRPRPP